MMVRRGRLGLTLLLAALAVPGAAAAQDGQALVDELAAQAEGRRDTVAGLSEGQGGNAGTGSILHDRDQQKQLLQALEQYRLRRQDGGPDEEAPERPDRDREGGQVEEPAGPSRLALDALIYTGPGQWALWLNGERLGPDTVPPEGVKVAAIGPGAATLVWRRHRQNETHRVTLHPGQVFDPASGRVRERGIPDLGPAEGATAAIPDLEPAAVESAARAALEEPGDPAGGISGRHEETFSVYGGGES